MAESSATKSNPRYLYRLILFASLLFSQSATFLLLQDLLPDYRIYAFSIFYFVAMAIFSLKITQQYSQQQSNQAAASIQILEHLGLLLSFLIFRLLSSSQNNLNKVVIICAVLLITQLCVIIIKIVYFGSVLPREIAQNSNLLKLLRVFKITLMAVLPLFLESPIVFVILFAIFQLFTAFAFCLTFTYQQSDMEQILMIGVIGGVFSALQAIIRIAFETPHFFLSQCLMLALFFVPHFSLLPLLEIKYLRLLSVTTFRENSSDVLTMFRFIRECLFQEQSTVQFSRQAKGKCWLFFKQLLRTKQTFLPDEESTKKERSLWQQLLKDQKLLQKQFFEVLCRNVTQKAHFEIFTFKLDCALKLRENEISSSLLMYYRFLDHIRDNVNILETSKIKRIYNQILHKVIIHKNHVSHKNCITFFQKLGAFLQSLNQVITQETTIVQSLISKKREQSINLEPYLLQSNQKKQHFNQQLQTILKDGFHQSSNQFKLALLIYYNSILKQPAYLKSQIKRHISNQERNSTDLRLGTYLVVINGFRGGEIINFNEKFKNKFKTNRKYFSSSVKHNISQYFMSANQAKVHALIMDQFEAQKQSNFDRHNQYECWLPVERELKGLKISILQQYSISTRVYYQNSNSFNYICQIQPMAHAQGSIMINSQLQQKIMKSWKEYILGFQRRKVRQLKQEFQVLELYLDQRFYDAELPIQLQSSKLEFAGKTDSLQSLPFLKAKNQQIQRKVFKNSIQKPYCSLCMVLEIAFIFCSALVIASVYLQLDPKISEQFSGRTKKSMIRDAIILRKRLFLQQQILSLVTSTSYFPDDICQPSSIPNMTSYMLSHLTSDIQNGYDDLMDLVVDDNKSNEFIQTVFTQKRVWLGSLENDQNINFIQFIKLFKESIILWINQVENNQQPPIDWGYYANDYIKVLQQTYNSQDMPFNAVDEVTDSFQKYLIADLRLLKVIIYLVISFCFVCCMLARLRENCQLLEYLQIVSNFPYEMLKRRQRELKLARSMFSKLKTSYIYQIWWQNQEIYVKSNEQMFEILEDCQNEGPQKKNIDNYHEEAQQMPLVKNKTTIQLHQTHLTQKIRNSIYYNKFYLLLFSSLLLAFFLCTSLYFDKQLKGLQSIESYDQLTEALSQIQQSYMNLLAYDWLKVVALNQDLNMSLLQQTFNDSITSLQNNQYETSLLDNYPRSIANFILYENICEPIIGAAICNKYRNGALTVGSSLLITLAVNQAIMFTQVSSNSTFNLPNLCDKTFLFFEVVLPFAKKIPIIASNMLDSTTNLSAGTMMRGSYLIVGALLLLTMVFQRVGYEKKKIVEKQLLSFDKIQNLYKISELKSVLNKAYYQ